MTTMNEHTTCDQRGEAHQVDSDALEEARAEGGSVRCLRCGKQVEQGPRNLEFRADVEH